MRPETLNWAGGEHEFALPLLLLDALQQRCDGDGVGLIFQRLCEGMPKVSDVTATVALGLEGGGMEKRAAVELVARQYEDHGLYCLLLVAQAVLGAALNGWPESDDTSGEDPGEAPKNP